VGDRLARQRRAPHKDHHAIVLLHGILGQEFVYWNLLKKYLRDDEYHFHEVRMPFLGFGDLRKSAAHLAQEVDQILATCPREATHGRVDIVAHSAGGLAARYYVKFLGGDRRVHALVTLGTPHHGTVTSMLMPVATVARQTLPGSDFLQELNEGDEVVKGVKYTSIYSPTDGVVVPPASAVLEGAANVKLRGLTHWGFLWRPKVYKAIREAIDYSHERHAP
jgi:triacylglycerol esterase/lipase EstA (alpha/beta hydrolase family)